MASSHSTIVFILVTLGVLATLVSATEYTVGDENGWTLDFDYQTWAKDKVFVVGDKLGMLYMYNSFYIVFLFLILGSRTMLISYKPFFFILDVVFNYALGTHNVVKVNGTGFQQCLTSSTNGTLTSGRDVITLQTQGRKWYICGVAKHCKLRNMKLVITVLPQTMSPAPTPALSQYASSALAAPTSYGFVVALLFGGLMSLLI
ncbi:putative Phytocyanin domain, cupredoxin [Helianthus annuus]|uniref:Phytocyanin domain, cupredoxin n=1 Tax=Helianthus annuus TaxID=4232 RepID=A0A251SVE7_HELAN|nr:putative Phytocyanin domain, cupredoxin [Helianthus annuus]KAJ0478129.1 putative Phytocyanin domain, cupredoxin [Helianthus annuus]KAJ0499011.1 putative Phytocyanin domain, cupredoxin [Helianthus annuus]KAJ0665025.1 putative Phytocyanin domain, cupredoxin [Helianthus annuus]KAJ0672447.1 putative Phytocyanin domain, cupredoxin [Helianthus annuus]